MEKEMPMPHKASMLSTSEMQPGSGPQFEKLATAK